MAENIVDEVLVSRVPSEASVRSSMPAVAVRRTHADMVGHDADDDDGDDEQEDGDDGMTTPLGDERPTASCTGDGDEPPASRRRLSVESATIDIVTPCQPHNDPTYFESVGDSDASGGSWRAGYAPAPRETVRSKARSAPKPQCERSFRPQSSWTPSIDAHMPSRTHAAATSGNSPTKPRPVTPTVVPTLRLPTIPVRAMGNTEGFQV